MQVQVSWKHDGEEINTNHRTNVVLRTKKGNAHLIISEVTEEDLGVYLCIGGNEKGKAEAVIKLSGKECVITSSTPIL